MEGGFVLDDIRILFADDEKSIRDMIREYLSPEGFIIDEAADGAEAMDLFRQNKYILVILDIMMPKMDGWSVCREIRKTSEVPVILLTARGEEYDKLFGFELGADDYVVKPFSPRLLLARIKAVIKRAAGNAGAPGSMGRIDFEGLSVELDSHNVYVDGGPIKLTPKEYELLVFFAQNPGRVFSREHLLDKVWGYDFAGDDRTVDTHVKMLRESLGKYRSYIVTIWGTGYKFETGGRK